MFADLRAGGSPAQPGPGERADLRFRVVTTASDHIPRMVSSRGGPLSEPAGRSRWHPPGRGAGAAVDQQAVRALALPEAGLGGPAPPLPRKPDPRPRPRRAP